MVHDYVSVSSSSSATPSFALSSYSPISYESDPEVVDHFPDSPFALLWEGTSPILCFAVDMRADVIPTFDWGSTSGIQIPFCFICGEDGHYPQDCQVYTQYMPIAIACLYCGEYEHYAATCMLMRDDG